MVGKMAEGLCGCCRVLYN